MNSQRIDKGKPLPSHTKLRYEECYAKIILEQYFSDKYESIDITDKPDLYDRKNNIGIEVTEAAEKELKEAVRLWYMMPYKYSPSQLRDKERMNQLGIKYQGGIQSWPAVAYCKGAQSEVYNVVYDAINKKLEKLNQVDLYKNARTYNLFIISNLTMHQEWYSDFIDKVQSIYMQYKKIYSTIYLLSQNDLAEIDMKSNKCIKVINIDNKQHSIAVAARKMVEDGEMND